VLIGIQGGDIWDAVDVGCAVLTGAGGVALLAGATATGVGAVVAGAARVGCFARAVYLLW